MNNSKYLFIFLLLIFSVPTFTQDYGLLSKLLKEQDSKPDIVWRTFSSTRIINSHSIERLSKREKDFRVNHRFGELSSGYEQFWGLDNALISLDFGYGINDWLMVGIRRSTYKKVIDGSLKLSLLRQTKGALTIPVGVSYYTNLAVDGRVDKSGELFDSSFTSRFAYTHQLIVARKFSDKLSLQVMPAYVHRNLVDFNEENDIFAVGVGGRAQVSPMVAITFEYFWTSHATNFFDKQEEGIIKYYNPLSIGVDLDTGGHVFQLFLSNTRIMEESGFLTETISNPLEGEIYFGFNISRLF